MFGLWRYLFNASNENIGWLLLNIFITSILLQLILNIFLLVVDFQQKKNEINSISTVCHTWDTHEELDVDRYKIDLK